MSIRPIDVSGVAVVIPAFNEEKLVGRCVASVLAAGLAPHQIFVIDDCSTDDTRGVLSAFTGIQIVANPTRLGKVRGLARAIAEFKLTERFDYLALLDADSHVDPFYFDEVVRTFQSDAEAVLVCGAPRSERGNWLTSYRAFDYENGGFIYREGQEVLGSILVAPGCASTYRTSIVDRLDWDGGTLVEDMDLTVQVHRRRLGTIRYAPRAISYTQDPRRMRDYIGQTTRWYSGTWQVMLLRHLPRGRQRIDFEFALLAVESLIYSVLVLLMPLLLVAYPLTVLRWFALDQLMVLVVAMVAAIRLRRADVFLWFPAYALIRAINCFIWIKTFWTEVVQGRSLRTWFTPQRYSDGSSGRAPASAQEAVCA